MALEPQLVSVITAIGSDIGSLDRRSNKTHNQDIANSLWTISHNMGKFPSVTIIDSSGDEVEGDVKHIDINNLTISFSSAFTGKAHLN